MLRNMQLEHADSVATCRSCMLQQKVNMKTMQLQSAAAAAGSAGSDV
jgi:hypothetical protein